VPVRPAPPSAALVAIACLSVLAVSPVLTVPSVAESGQRETPRRRDSDRSQDRLLLERLAEFLSWAHPQEDGCRPATGLRLVNTWDEGFWARYQVACGNAPARSLDGVFRTREGEGVWQVHGGFEAPTALVEEALRAGKPGRAPDGGRRTAGAPAAGAPGREAGPPSGGPNEDAGGFASLVHPETIDQPVSELPEEAGRARMIGTAHVELLVDISPEGKPVRVRTLRGPTPDLGMRRAASETVLRGRYRPATLAGRPVRYFLPSSIAYEGLPPESTSWLHRALFQVEAIVASDRGRLLEARRRLDAGEPFDRVAAGFASAEGGARSGDWGLVAADSLPAPLREALHQLQVGGHAGPVEAEGRHYLLLKRGEVYYAIRGADREEFTYQIVHQKSPLDEETLRRAVESDLAGYVGESRRRAYMNEASRAMGIRQTRRDIGRLAIHTDVLDDREIEMLGLVVDAAIGIHEEFWMKVLPLRPFREQIQVYAYARSADHLRLFRMWSRGRVGGPLERLEPERPEPIPDGPLQDPAGEYIPESRILAFSCEEMEGHLPVPIAIHEAIHMLNYERVYGEGVAPSHWFDEGLASYFSLSQLDSRLRIQPGEIRRSGSLVQGGVKVQFDPRAQLRAYLESVRERGPVSLEVLIGAGSKDRLWTSRPERAYGASWTLVHFLQHGDKGRHRAGFIDYARLEARGEGGAAAFRRLFGPGLAALETAWHAYEEQL
jgi:hypothetical protein